MTIKQLEKASLILEKIKVLDKEINDLNKIAIKVSEGNGFPKIKFSVNDKQLESKKAVLDSDGSLVNQVEQFRTYFIDFNCNGSIKSTNIEEPKIQSIDTELTDSIAFMVLDLILKDKEFKRNIFIVELQKLGFKLT